MKNSQIMLRLFFSAVLYTSVYMHASGEVDKELFFNYRTNKHESPYASELVNAALQNHVLIEKELFSILHQTAEARIANKFQALSATQRNAGQLCFFLPICLSPNTPADRSVDPIAINNHFKILGRAIAHTQIAAQRINAIKPCFFADTGAILVPEKDLLFLLQWSFGIRRTREKVEVMLDENGATTALVMPLLMSVINKYRAQEQP